MGDPQFWIVTAVVAAIALRAAWTVVRGVRRRRRGAPVRTRVALTVDGARPGRRD